MLKKVLKYDSRNIFKFLSIFYSLALFFSILTRIFLSIENSAILNIIGKICSGTLISMIANILINNLLRLWARFRSNLYSDESYLTHTLPVKKDTLYLSKIIVSLLTMFVSFLVIGLTLFIAYYSKENITIIKNILLPIADTYNSTIIGLLLIILFLMFLEFINILQIGYTGIILGHRKNSNKIVYSIILAFLSYIALQIFVLIILFGGALFNENIMNLFTSSVINDIKVLKTSIYISIVAYIITYIINYIINIKCFKKGVNID